MQWSRVGGDAVEVAGQVIRAEEYELRFKAAEGLDAVSFDGSAGVVVLDTQCRRRTSNARASPATSSASCRWRARTPASTSPTASGSRSRPARPRNDAIAAHLDTVKHETLAVAFGRTEATPQGFVSEGKLGDEPIAIGVSLAA